ncbi:MAG: hypothetical protein PHV28_11195 [Kiritimatiellae bacterium]|nr:hypothetical protein [Kiritimatiellia bacterium]
MKHELPETLSSYFSQETHYSEKTLAAVALSYVREHTDPVDHPLALAAIFDLVVASKFYRDVKPENWLWCEHGGHDFYPILNTCPFCILENRLVQHAGNKPSSGVIGPATSQAIREVFAAHYHFAGSKNISIFCGVEPADLVVVDYQSKNIFIAEVKAAPLFTPPLAVKHSSSFSTGRTLPLKHSIGTLRGMEQQEVCLFLPMAGGKHFSWSIPKNGLGDPSWPESALIEAIKANPSSFHKYLESWKLLWEAYTCRDTTNPAFWFTGACGLPRDPGEGWPKTGDGKPKGTISDGKTSVGMDRTDDIKKSTFQVLKLGVETRQIDLQDWSLKIGLASNLHAVRHYDDYLLPYADIVWGWSEASVSPNKWYNLYDGIVAFSKSHTRDKWLTDITDWTR